MSKANGVVPYWSGTHGRVRGDDGQQYFFRPKKVMHKIRAQCWAGFDGSACSPNSLHICANAAQTSRISDRPGIRPPVPNAQRLTSTHSSAFAAASKTLVSIVWKPVRSG